MNNYDEFIEVENLGPGIVDLENWKLDVMPDSGSSPFVLPSRKLNPNERAVFFGSTTRLLLEDSGDTVRLIDSRGVVEDAFTYPAVLQPDDSWCRTRDGIGNWRDGCFPRPELKMRSAESSHRLRRLNPERKRRASFLILHPANFDRGM